MLSQTYKYHTFTEVCVPNECTLICNTNLFIPQVSAHKTEKLLALVSMPIYKNSNRYVVKSFIYTTTECTIHLHLCF